MQRVTPGVFSIALLFSLGHLFFSSLAINAQTTAARPDRGLMPNASYSVSDIESINLQNGNVNLAIPLASLPPVAGSKLSWTISAYYNSKPWDIAREQRVAPTFGSPTYVVDVPQAPDTSGWRISAPYSLETRDIHSDFNYSNPSPNDPEYSLMVDNSWYKVILRMPDGAEHELRPTDYSSYPGVNGFMKGYYKESPFSHGAMRYYSYDGSHLFAIVSADNNWTVYMPDGAKIVQTTDGIQRIHDSNGNRIKIYSDTNGTHYQDEQSGREIRYSYNPSANGGLGQGQAWYQTVGGVWQHVDVNFGFTSVQGKAYRVKDWDTSECQRYAHLDDDLYVIREIILPQTEPNVTRKFAFTYNSDATVTATDSLNFTCSDFEDYTRTTSKGWGSLSQMTLPSGAVVNYTYDIDLFNFVISADSIAGQRITQKKVTHDGTDDIWTYNIGLNSTFITNPDGSTVSENRFSHNPSMSSGVGKSGLVYRTTQPFTKVERHWTDIVFDGANRASPDGTLDFNAVVDEEYTTLTDVNNNPLRMSAKLFQYDYNGNVTQTTEYDWFDPALVSRDALGVPTGVPAGATVLRVTANNYYNQASTASSANVYAKRSVSTGVPSILNAPKQTTIGPTIVQFSYDAQPYGVAPTVGNMTTKAVWDDLDSKWITTSNTYDLYGNVATATDGRGKVTQFFYDDATHALPNRVVVDPQNGTGTQTASTAYDFSTGLVTSQTDVNSQVTDIDYTNQLLGSVDPFGRPGMAKAPAISINGTNHRRRITTTYRDSARQVIVEADLNAENDKLLKTRATMDMLARPSLSESTEDGSNYTISARNLYLNMGQVTLTSSPMRSAAAPTDSWTRVTKDGAGRVTQVATFGGATQPTWTGTAGSFTGAVTTAYDANFTTVTDQAGKVRRSMVDALDRLVRVDEPDAAGSLGSTSSPVQKTEYEYDVLSNLKKVTQDTQERTFTYDSLSRLRTAINPESGTINYQYDDNGNLIVKTDARSVSTHYEYDSINRITRRWYNGSNSTSQATHNVPALPSGVGATDEAKFYYDSQAPPGGAPLYSPGSATGRLVAQTYGTGSNGDYYAYDVLGRPNRKIQQIGAINYQITAGYSLSGAVSSMTYPSGRTISNTHDQAGRLTNFSGNLGGTPRTYSTGNVYTALGGLLKEQFGTDTAVYHKQRFNSRAQICDIRASTVNDESGGELGAIVNYYNYPYSHCGNGPDNNGNLLMSQTIINSVYFEDRYSYDSLNRLADVNEYLNGATYIGKQEYDYDRWGNRTLKSGSTLGVYKEFTVDLANNRLGVPATQPQSMTMSYDSAGNLVNDTYTGKGSRTYDAENKITSASGVNQAQAYGYDAAGQRVKRTVDSVTTWQVYGFGGELLSEYPANGAATTPQKEYGYRNGELLITAVASTGGSISSGLRGNWRFDENSGTTAADASGNNNTGTLSSGATWTTGQSGAATNLDGVDDYVQVGAQSSLALTNAGTLSAWIYPTGAGSLATYGGIILNKEGEYELARFQDGTIQWAFANTNPGWNWVNTGYVAPLNQWTHVAVTYDNGTVKTYINGTLYHTHTGSGAIGDVDPSMNDFRIGGRQVTSHNFQGRIDEAKVYNQALSASEVTTLLPPPTSGLAGNWKFDENSGTTAADSSGNNNTGTLSSGAAWATGQSGAATNLDGVDDYVQVGAQSSLALTSAGTLSAWIYPTGAGSLAPYGGIILNKEGEYELARFTDGTIQWAFANTNPGWNWVNTGYVAPLNQWTHVAVTYDGGTVKTYINGTLYHTHTGSGAIGDVDPSMNDFRIGGRQITSHNFQGRIDEVKVYNRALSASEVPTLPSGTGSSSNSAQINWLVSDHLGTPRMILDQTGKLENVRRHDYLPFGEELLASPGGRSEPLGYTADDGVRQQFTAKERDIETGLDYFGARYFASEQGRFTGADPYDINLDRQNTPDRDEADALFRKYIAQPQHWNRYAYALNNPLRYVDPDGLMEYETELLGQKIKVHIDDSIIKNDPDALKRIQDNLQKAFDKINSGAASLSEEQIESIHSQNRIYVSNDNPIGTVGGTFYITQRMAENSNIDKLSGDIIHDSRHSEQWARGLSYNEANAIPMEREASLFTVGVINNIGGWSGDVVEGYEVDAIAGHLPSGMRDKSTPNSLAKVFEKMNKPQKRRK